MGFACGLSEFCWRIFTYQNDLVIVLLHEDVHLLVLKQVDGGGRVLPSLPSKHNIY